MNSSRKEIQLSDHFNYSTLLRFTVPSILMMVISSCYSIVDGLFISNFAGSDAFAAVNLIMPIAMLISCFGFMAGMGGSALVSKTLGEKQDDNARAYFSLIVYLIIAFSVVVGVAVFLLIPNIASLMGAEGGNLRQLHRLWAHSDCRVTGIHAADSVSEFPCGSGASENGDGHSTFVRRDEYRS